VSIYRYNMRYMVLGRYVSVLASGRQWYFTECLFQSTGAIDVAYEVGRRLGIC
jgi:hypothetical protein